jgi:serine/threonine protein kinase
MSLATGARLGPYEILSPLGRGGMGEVYRATDTRLGRDVAVKVIRSDTEVDATQLARFEDETRAIAALNHPNILALHDIGNANGVVYAVMELLDGETLRTRLARGRLPVVKTIDFAIQIARGLAAAHERGFIHRDLKPDNLFITQDGRSRFWTSGSRIRKRRPAPTPIRRRHGSRPAAGSLSARPATSRRSRCSARRPRRAPTSLPSASSSTRC